MFDIGRIVMKIAGRDAGKVGVVIDVLDENYVMVDGAMRRRKCNVKHIEPMNKTVEVKKNASHSDVIKVLEITEKKSGKKEKKEKASRPKKVRKKKVYDAPKKAKVEKKVESKEKVADKKPEEKVKVEKKKAVKNE